MTVLNHIMYLYLIGFFFILGTFIGMSSDHRLDSSMRTKLIQLLIATFWPITITYGIITCLTLKW